MSPQPPPPNRPPPRPLARKKASPALDPAVEKSRRRGALLGLAVGDALGATHEMRKLNAPLFPQLCENPQTEMLGKGPFNLKRGQVTDETQLACCVAQVLKTYQRYDLFEAKKQYLAWLPLGFDVEPQTKRVLQALVAGKHLDRASREDWVRESMNSYSNGALARTVPIGVFFARDQKARVQASLDDAALTHFDPRCQLTCVALNAAIAFALTSLTTAKPEQLTQAAVADTSLAGASLGKVASDLAEKIQSATKWIREDFEAARAADPMLYGPELHLLNQMRSVRVTFRLAFWELFHAPSYERALIDVVNRGGDTDTNGAVTGALFGAVYGEEAIPERWRAPVLEVLGEPRAGPLGGAYHPRTLLTLAD